MLDPLASWQDRPLQWRKQFKASDILADYQNRYPGDDPDGKIDFSQVEMGPFYEKYLKKMGQTFVKDRVRRLQETFQAARTG